MMKRQSLLKWVSRISIGTLIIISWAAVYWSRSLFTNEWENNAIDAFLYLLTAIGSIGLFWIAVHQFSKISESSEAEFLLKVDERWSSREILKAREIIHGCYLEVYRDKQGDKRPLENVYDSLGKKIREIAENQQEKVKFIYLLNFLDFMETIGYLCEGKHITRRSLDALCGESLEFNYYKIFEPYICDERTKYGKQDLYTAFEKLYCSGS